MFQMAVPWWEFVVRGVAIYAFLMVFLRLTGRRQTGQYAPMDLVLLLILSNAVQNAMNAGDNSLIGGMVSALTLMGCHALMEWLSFKNRRIARWIDGAPQVLIHDGVINTETLAKNRLSADDIKAALRANGCLHASDVALATLETNGQITVVTRSVKNGDMAA